MKTLQVLLISIYFCLLINACTQDDAENTVTPIKEYESCCGAEPVESNFISGQYLFVPNVFTPNGDGINDYWYPRFSSGPENISAVLIYTETADTLIHEILPIWNYPEGKYGWDGLRTRKDNLAGDFKIHKGGFRYEIYFFESVNFGTGDIKFKGKACAVTCDEDAKYFKDKEGCFFPAQTDGTGKLDKSIKPTEESCFGN